MLAATTVTAVETVHQLTYSCFSGTSKVACSEVCSVCHPSEDQSEALQIEGQQWNPGMATVLATYPALYPKEESEWSGLDPEHRACKSCHLDHAALIRNHPVAVEYSEQHLKSRLRGEPSDLPLFDKLVLCATCHNPHSNARALLRKEDWQSALCLSCHIKN